MLPLTFDYLVDAFGCIVEVEDLDCSGMRAAGVRFGGCLCCRPISCTLEDVAFAILDGIVNVGLIWRQCPWKLSS